MLPRTSRIVALCSAANFINAADRVIMPIAIVPMTDEFKWNLYWQGWILSAFAFGYFTSQVKMTSNPLRALRFLCHIHAISIACFILDHWCKHSKSFRLQNSAHAGGSIMVHQHGHHSIASTISATAHNMQSCFRTWRRTR
jgi:hypothetical protein